MEKLQAQEDILINIFVGLPVKSILWFRCVSKAWCKLLKDPYLVKTHLARTIEMNKFSVMMHSDSTIYASAYDPSLSTLSNRVRINYPYNKVNRITFWGTCNGLICLSPGSEDAVVLWNPATTEFKKVPIESPHDEFRYVHHGFCTYNDEIDDFKVVRFEGGDDVCEVKVYTLKSNSWRRLQNIPYKLSRGYLDMAQVIVNGAMHFSAYTDSKSNKLVIVSFDFKHDRFDEMPLPNFRRGCNTGLCSLGGSLCLLESIFHESRVDVWEMKMYGVTESWAKLFTIDYENIGEYFGQLVPLQLVKNRKILLGMGAKAGFRLGLYDIQNKTFINLKIHAHSATTFVYVESLVMLNSGTYVGPPETDSEEELEENDDDSGKETEIEDFEDSEEDLEENDDDSGKETEIEDFEDSEEDLEEYDDDSGKETEIEDLEDSEEDFEENDDDLSEEEDLY